MRRFSLLSLVLLAFGLHLAPGAVSAQVEMIHTPADSPRAVAERSARLERVGPALSIADRADVPDDVLFVPYYFVDPATSDTTLFAVRNTSAADTSITVSYYGLSRTNRQRVERVELEAKQIYSVNIRDVWGLTAQPDGTFQGHVVIDQNDFESFLAGDYFQVDTSEDFATGDQLAREEDFCSKAEVRFLEGGPIDGGSELVLFLNLPRGSNPNTFPPSVIVKAYDEAGIFLGTTDIYAAQNIVVVPAADFAFGASFGGLELDFNGSTGMVKVTYSAAGRYSIGMNATCTTP